MIRSKWILNEICITIQTNEYGFYGMLHSNCSGVCVVHQNMQFLFGVCSTQLCTSHLYKSVLHDKTITLHKTTTNQHSRPNLFHETVLMKSNRFLNIWLIYFKFMSQRDFWLYQQSSSFPSLSCLINFFFLSFIFLTSSCSSGFDLATGSQSRHFKSLLTALCCPWRSSSWYPVNKLCNLSFNLPVCASYRTILYFYPYSIFFYFKICTSTSHPSTIPLTTS